MSNKNYASGLYYNHPRKGAPDFVVGAISIHVERLEEWLKTVKANDAGYINIDVLEGKEKPYCVLNEYVPKNTQQAPPDNDDVIDEDIPF